jgi:EAL domain-containing protein (putative c-di-GMP-specific phosphodiesterase class I)
MGYSSFSYLKNFDLSSIKIPREFVADTPNCTENVSIVGAVAALAHSFTLPIVAEGVECTEELDFLRDIGCDAIQGYYLCQPSPPETVWKFITEKAQIVNQ